MLFSGEKKGHFLWGNLSLFWVMNDHLLRGLRQALHKNPGKGQTPPNRTMPVFWDVLVKGPPPFGALVCWVKPLSMVVWLVGRPPPSTGTASVVRLPSPLIASIYPIIASLKLSPDNPRHPKA